MKKRMLVLGMVIVMAAPMALLAADGFDPLAGAVKFGEHTPYTELIWKPVVILEIDETGIRGTDDLGYGFTPDTQFYSASGIPLSRMNFRPGSRVKIVLKRDPDTKALVEIVRMIKD